MSLLSCSSFSSVVDYYFYVKDFSYFSTTAQYTHSRDWTQNSKFIWTKWFWVQLIINTTLHTNWTKTEWKIGPKPTNEWSARPLLKKTTIQSEVREHGLRNERHQSLANRKRGNHLGAFPGRECLHFPVMADQAESETIGFSENRSDNSG